MDQVKINAVVNAFFNSLKMDEDKLLDTGFTNNATVDVLRLAVVTLIHDHPERFEQYVKFFEFGCMYLQDETDELPEVEKIGR